MLCGGTLRRCGLGDILCMGTHTHTHTHQHTHTDTCMHACVRAQNLHMCQQQLLAWLSSVLGLL